MMKAKTVLISGLVFMALAIGFAASFGNSPLDMGVGALQLRAMPLDGGVAGRTPAAPDVAITVDQVVVSGLQNPVQVTHAGDNSGRLFVVEQPGRLRVVADGALLPTPLLDLTQRVTFGGERGLLGLAFHPSYETNGYFYVNYTRAGDGATVIARYRVSTGNPNLADAGSEQVLLTVAQPYTNHNGGQLLFSPRDGYLYIGMGDGGSGGDPLNNAQNPATLLGAMLRLDVDRGVPYAVPADNPYVGIAGRDEIWAIGLRNPWRFSFDRAAHDLYIGDVGQNLWEEIDYQRAGTPGGINYGWRCKEGTHDYNMTGACLTAALTDPIAEYSHTEGRSVTGGFVYRGSSYPALAGRYFYADFVEGKIWSTVKTGSNPDSWSPPELELDTGLAISAFGEDEEGELYVVDWAGGTVRRLADLNGPSANLSTSRKRPSAPAADPGEVVTYTVAVVNTGGLVAGAAHLTDTVPAGLAYVPDSLWASHGTWDDSNQPTLTWQGGLGVTRQMTITYQVTVTGLVTGSIVNRAALSADTVAPLTLAASVYVPRSELTTTGQDFFLPGTQPGGLHAAIPPAIDCDTCHSAPIYDRWRGSMMGQAGRDPLMWAALALANVDAPGSGDYCLRCHTPGGWLAGRSHPADGSALVAEDMANGVSCNLCHRLVDPVASTTDEAALIDLVVREALTATVPADYVGSATLIVDPEDNRRGPFSFGLALPYHTAYQTDYLRQGGGSFTVSRVCGTCHNVDNPALSWDPARKQYWPNESASPAADLSDLFPVERTFDEWLFSDYARGGVYAPQFAGDKPDGVVQTCQDCHLPRATGLAADSAFNPIYRDCLSTGCLPEHRMVGGNTWVPQLLASPDWRLSAPGEAAYLHQTELAARAMLRKAATMTLTLTVSDTVKVATVRVINQTGHKLPTGYPEGRQMWLNLRAYDAAGALIYESGAYDAASGQLERDPDIKVYEVKQGMTEELAALLGKPAGASFHFVLNNTVVKDNRIPPRGYQVALYDQPGLQPVGADYADAQHWDDTVYLLPLETERVMVTLYYQTASREYVSFLQANGGVDGLALGELWGALSSPPEVVARAWLPSYDVSLPCVMRSATAGLRRR
jgi:uncharacterized repeat protein (TIGR01451 family)